MAPVAHLGRGARGAGPGRPLWMALIGIGALGAVSMLLIVASVGPPVPPAPDRLPPTPATAPVAPKAPLDVPRPPVAAAGPPSAPPEEEAWAPPEPAAAAGPWESIPPVSRFPSLGRIGPGVSAALSELHERRLLECFDAADDTKLRGAMEEEAGGVEDDTPVLLLSLETSSGTVRIAAATVERRGSAGDRLLSCALAGLRGATLPVPEARSGARHRLRYRLAQSTPSSPL